MEASCFCAPGLMLGGDDEKELKPSPSPNDLSTFANSSTASSINSMAKAVDGSPSNITSPSAIPRSRKLSDVIATSAQSRHPSFAGRQVTVLSSGSFSDSESPTLLETLFKSKKSRKVSQITLEEKKESEAQESIPKPKLHRSDSAPTLEDKPSKFRHEPQPLRLDAWAEPAAETFPVRGKNYRNDGKKYPSERAAFRLLTVDIVNTETPIYEGLCSHPNERLQLALKRESETGVRELPPFVFAVNLCIPGNVTYHQVSYYGIDNMEEIVQGKTPFGRLMKEFIFGESDQFRDDHFKLIPRIVEGNYIVRKAVGTKPSILGKKIKQYYVRGERFFEMIVDIASDPIAQRIVKLALGFARSLTTDIMYVLEGSDEETLPERIFGGVRLKGIDFERKDGKRTVMNVAKSA